MAYKINIGAFQGDVPGSIYKINIGADNTDASNEPPEENIIIPQAIFTNLLMGNT